MLDPVIRKAAQIMRTVSGSAEFVCGYDRAGYYFQIEREGDMRWYIIVKHPDGGALYDGWWSDSEEKSLAEAVQEAVRGACLVPERATQSAQAAQKGGE